MKINFTSISILILSISIFASALVISNSLTNLQNSEISDPNQEKDIKEKQIQTKKEIADYLGISIQKFDELNEWQKLNFGNGFPYLEDMNGNKYYTIQSIEEWLTDNSNYLSKN